MSIDTQSLRQTAEKAQEHGVFNMDMHSETVLALLDELEAAKARIAELEAREVKLPQRQEPTSSGHYGEGYLVPSNAGSALDYEETVEAIRAAGITVKGE